MMRTTYTNSWALAYAAPRIMKNGRVYRPSFNEVVGEKDVETDKLHSCFEADMPYLPDAAPVLERLLQEEKVQPREDKKEEYVIRYNICQQCSREFPAKAANKRFCPECAEERKREADRYAWIRRKAKKKAEKKETSVRNDAVEDYVDTLNDEFVGTEIGCVSVSRLVKDRKASSLYLCKCSCGEEFVAYQSVLLAKSLQMCPSCMNRMAKFQYHIPTNEILDVSSRSKELLVGRLSGFLSVKEMINESLLLCNCGCGKRIVVTTNDFLSHSVTSCGCISNDVEIQAERKSVYVGRKKSFVTCVKATSKYQFEVGKKGRAGSQWMLCQCDCGTEFFMTRSRFASKCKGTKTFSCGCMKHKNEIVSN